MAKAIHTMIRVIDEAKSVDFYSKGFRLKVKDRYDFDGFTLVYLKNDENDFEVELTVNRGRTEAYTHGTGYGHLALSVSDIEFEHKHFESLGFNPNPIKEFHREGALMAKFFFVTDPDGYKIEVLQRHGRFT
jgi:lactoylglutathione lyase